MSSAPRPRLLVIDDDEATAELIGRVGEIAGYASTVVTEFDGFRAHYGAHIQAVTIDLVMPNVDGVELIRFLAEAGSKAAVLLISGVDRRVLAGVERLAVERGLHVVGRLSKPIDAHLLQNVLAEVCALEPLPAVEPVSVDPGELRRAIEQDQLHVLYQPKVGLGSRSLAGVEVMLRWRHPEHGPLDPERVVTVAEAAGLAMPLTELVVETAFGQLAPWLAANPARHVALNVSARCLDDITLPESLERRARAHGIATDRVILEITESCLPKDPATGLDVTSRLRLKGFELAIDDFGTGCATLEVLRRLPFTELKIDQTFVRGLATDVDAMRIIASTIDLGRSLGMRVVAEGIETGRQWKELERLGCDLGQGFLIGPPMRADELSDWLQGWQSAA